jgi:hypothetical protein
MLLPEQLCGRDKINPRSFTHGEDFNRFLQASSLDLRPEILFPFLSGDDPSFNSRRTEDAKSEIDVSGTAENEDFLPAEPERILSVYPQFLVIDAVVPTSSRRAQFLTERARTDQLPIMVRAQKVHQSAIFSAP